MFRMSWYKVFSYYIVRINLGERAVQIDQNKFITTFNLQNKIGFLQNNKRNFYKFIKLKFFHELYSTTTK